MKRILYLTIFLYTLCGMSVYAQSRGARGKAWRLERERQRAVYRALEQHQDSVSYQEALSALRDGSWVLEANNINFPNGLTRFVSSNTNYVSLTNGQGTIQTAYANFTYSPNGLGGVTVQGNVSGVSMSQDKDGNVYYSFNIQGNAISAVVSVTLTGGTNQASATITPNFTGRTITFDGYLVPYAQGTIFQGMPQW
jgi:hypothetical protein